MEKKLQIKEGASRTALDLGEIVYMEKDKSRIIIHTSQRQYCIYRSFCSIQQELDQRFMKPHESFIINMDHVLHTNQQEVMLRDGTSLKFGIKCARKARHAFEDYMSRNKSDFI